MFYAVLATMAQWVLLAIALVPLERQFSARSQPILRPEWSTDLLFYLGQSLVWVGLVVGLLLPVGAALQSLPSLEWVRWLWSRQPWLLQVVEVVMLGDLVVYGFHRACHTVPVLWRFHRVHHTAEHLDWMAAFREHPLDGLCTQLLVNLPAFVLGFPLATIGTVAIARGAWGLFIHSNVRMELGPLKYLVGAPSLHHWHHDLEHGGRCNFANLAPWIDVLFGTYAEPPREPERYGVRGPRSRSYLGLLVDPFWF